MRDIGKNIRDLRERAKLTQDALAEQLCTTRQTISNYERGKTRPDVEQILRLAAILGQMPMPFSMGRRGRNAGVMQGCAQC